MYLAIKLNKQLSVRNIQKHYYCPQNETAGTVISSKHETG